MTLSKDQLEEQLAQQLLHREGELPARWRLPEVAEAVLTVIQTETPNVLGDCHDREAELLVVGRDMLGALALISGTLAVHRISIIEADIHTVKVSYTVPGVRTVLARPPFRKPRQRTDRLLVDFFRVKLPPAEQPELLVQTVAREIQDILARGQEARGELQDRLIERFSEVIRAQPPPEKKLYPVRLRIDNEQSPNATLLEIESTDTLGFVFEFSNALSLLNFNIVRVEIRTEGNAIRDRFWITTAHGEKVTDPAALADLRFAAVVIKQFTHLLPTAPNPTQALRQFSELARDVLRWSDWKDRIRDLSSDQVLRTLARVLGASEFLWEDFLRLQHESLFPLLTDQPQLERSIGRDELERALRQAVSGTSDWAERVARFNRVKDREMFRIDLRHLTERIGFEQFGFELTELAEAVVRVALDLAVEWVRTHDGIEDVPPLAVFGLGKLGGRELGFASDIELFLCYDDRRIPAERQGEVQRIADDVVRALLKIIQARREGIFEVDLRLRPYGRQGPLVPSLSLCDRYYRPGGGAVQLERLALVKLRPIGGSSDLVQAMGSVRDRFVYSGAPVDYANIRDLRARQVAELTESGRLNAKYSPGGLVDIEYFVQARQIEAGAQDTEVRVTNTLEALHRLERRGWVPSEWAAQLSENYRFLRRLIDALRVVRGNAKDLHLPEPTDPEYRYLASRLGYPDAEALEQAIGDVFQWTSHIWERAMC